VKPSPGLLASLTVAAALGGCASITDVQHPFEPAARWGADRTGEGERLWFGLPNSDDADLMLTCQPHSGRIEVFATADVDRPTVTMMFESGKTTSRHFMKRLDSDDGYGGFISADDPALVAFSRTGEIATSAAGKRIRFPPAKALAAAFLTKCAS
jgi:hypothetical protein